MNTDTEYLTEEKVELLKKELEELKTVKRKEVLETLEFAKSLGDLSENAEYHQARDDQGKLEDRIARIEHMLINSVIVSPGGHGTTVDLGSTVTLSKNKSKEHIVYTIVGIEESDTLAGKISHKSPLGEALMGKKKDDTVTINTPKGDIVYSIISVK